MTTPDASPAPVASKGLKNVVAADSYISRVDGQIGALIYRGYHIDDLAENVNYEECCYLLLKGELPNASQLKAFSDELVQYRELPEATIELIKSIAKIDHPMATLRTAVSHLGVMDPDSEEHGPEPFYHQAIKLISQISSIVAYTKRVRADEELVPPRADLGHSANFMYMLNGEEPSEDAVKAMDLILILHAEHGLNASTFAGRVISATLSDMYSAITGAIGGLKGPLHGGANTAVLNALQEVGTVEKVGEWIDGVKARKGKFMGFGHAVYQVQDPRAKFLKDLSGRLGKEKGDSTLYDISVEMEKQVTALINKNCNVDFYSASLQYYMGISGDLFTCIFAASRISGWAAHIIEQVTDNKIIRPKANYVGPDLRSVVPIEQR